MLRTSREKAQPLPVLLLLTNATFYPEPTQRTVCYQKKIGLKFLFTSVATFLASCFAHVNMHTCRTRTLLSMGPSVHQQAKHNSPSNTSVSKGQQVNCKDRLGVDSGPAFALLCENFFLFHRGVRWGLPLAPCCSHVRLLAPLLHLANPVCCSSHYV